MTIREPKVLFDLGYCQKPECLVITNWRRPSGKGKGVTLSWRHAETKQHHGIRDVGYGPLFEIILKAWIDDARKRGLDVNIFARRAKHLPH
jgi:hypothetical protein